MVVDSSAVVAILQRELGSERLSNRLAKAPSAIMSVANYVETGQVLAQRARSVQVALDDFHNFLRHAGIALAAIDEAQARIALDARIRFGRGFGHPARLNYSDSFAYALAKTRDLPLLFVGDDFNHTDIVPALP
jgi:ribonuclease VapC